MMSRTGLVLVGLMALLLALFPGACAAKGEGQYCAPSSCGNIRNISYPFRLKTDPPECGYQRLELACESNRTILYTCGGKYYVQEISYGDYSENMTMRVVDASLDDKDSCFILHYSLTNSKFSACPYYPSSDNATVLMNCGTQAAKSSRYVDVTPCVGNSSSPKTNLYALYTDIQRVSDLHGHKQCRIEAIFPPLFSINSTTGGQLSILDIHHELLKGFDLYYFDYWNEYKPPTFFARFWSFMKDLRYFLLTLPGYHTMFGDNKEFDYQAAGPGYSITGRIASYIIKDFIVDGGAEIPDEDDGRRIHRRPLLPREDDQEDVEALERSIQACKGLRNIYAMKVMLVPSREMTDVLSVESKAIDLATDTWVRMKIGTYKGDLAKVMYMESLAVAFGM